MRTTRLLRLLPALCLAVCLTTVCALADGTLALGTNSSVSMSENGTRYTFTPAETGPYRIRSEGGWYEYYGEDEVRGQDPNAELYLGTELIAEVDDIDSENANFRFCLELTANTTYTLILYSNFGGTISLPVCIERPTPVTVTSWDTLRGALLAGGPVTLGGNVAASADSEWQEVPKYTVSTLDLNGHTVDGSALTGRNGNDSETLHVVGTLTLQDSVGTGRVTAPGANDNVNGAVTVSDASFTMAGGTITASGTPCGVLLWGGAFAMNGGTVSVSDAKYGAVEVNGGVFTLTNGTVSASGEASENGAVYVSSGSFDMRGGTVSAASGAKCGVYVSYDAEAAISGGTVSASGVKTGGVHVCYAGRFHLSGAPSIDSVYLESSAFITVVGPLTGSAPLPVIPEYWPAKGQNRLVTSGLYGNGTAAGFTVADPKYAVLPNKDGEAVVSLAPVSYVDENGEARTTTEYVPISAESNFYGNSQFEYTGDGWLVVPPGRFSLNKVKLGYYKDDKINLILCDGASLEIATQLECHGPLTVYGQGEGTGSLRVGSETSPSTADYAIKQYATQSVDQDTAPNLTVCGGVVAAYGGTSAAIHSFTGCAVSGGTLIAHGQACGIKTYLDENRYVTVTVSGGAVSFSSVRANLRITEPFTVDGGTDVNPAADWWCPFVEDSDFNVSAYAGKTLRVVDSSFSGLWGADDTLVASVSVPWSAPRLLAAAYDGTGRLRGAHAAVVGEAGRVRTGLPKNDGWTYKLMLVDQNYAPLLPAWEKTLAENDLK